ncbi:hypothetical protein HG530_014011 [Fusarium avenaceum]|nr:hypothetical protein HG530_014011 [Fusarium avenaceum]
MVAMAARRLPMSPALTVSRVGIKPGFLTMKAISSEGSPPTEKNSRPESFSTKSRNAGTLPIFKKGWASPREPITMITMFKRARGTESATAVEEEDRRGLSGICRCDDLPAGSGFIGATLWTAAPRALLRYPVPAVSLTVILKRPSFLTLPDVW